MLLAIFRRGPADDLLLTRSIESLAGQEEACTLVLIDDGSPTPVAVPRVTHAPAVIHVRLGRNRGLTAALNAGLAVIRRERFEFVARLDAGDRCQVGRLAAQVEFLRAHPDHVLVGGGATWEDLEGRPVTVVVPPTTHETIARALPRTNCFIHPAVMFRTTVLDVIGGYDESFRVAQDYEFFWRQTTVGKVANLCRSVVVTLSDPQGLSRRRLRAQVIAALRTRMRYADWSHPLTYLGLTQGVVQGFIHMLVPPRVRANVKRRLHGTAGIDALRAT